MKKKRKRVEANSSELVHYLITEYAAAAAPISGKAISCVCVCVCV